MDVFDVRQQLAIVERTDCRPLRRRCRSRSIPTSWASGSRTRWPTGCRRAHLPRYKFQAGDDGSLYWMEGEKRVAQRPSGGLYFDYIDFPLAHAKTVKDIEAYDFRGFSEREISAMAAAGKKLFTETDKAIMGRFSGSVYDRGQKLRGFEQFMIDLADGGPFLEALLNCITDAHIETLKAYLDSGRRLHPVDPDERRPGHAGGLADLPRPCIAAGSSRSTNASTATSASTTRTCTCSSTPAAPSGPSSPT